MSPRHLRAVPDTPTPPVPDPSDARDDVPAQQNRAALSTIGRARPEFLRIVGAPGWQTPATRRGWPESTHPLQDLTDLVGDLTALEHLDTTPLPDEPFAWAEVPGELVPVLEDLVPLLDSCADRRSTVCRADLDTSSSFLDPFKKRH